MATQHLRHYLLGYEKIQPNLRLFSVLSDANLIETVKQEFHPTNTAELIYQESISRSQTLFGNAYLQALLVGLISLRSIGAALAKSCIHFFCDNVILQHLPPFPIYKYHFYSIVLQLIPNQRRPICNPSQHASKSPTIRPLRPSLQIIFRCQCGYFFRHSRSNKLVDRHPFLLGKFFDMPMDGIRQP